MTSLKKNSDPVSGVIWITGLSGSGKTTLATKLRSKYLENDTDVIHLDGDELRVVLGVDGGYDSASRLSIGKTYARLARMLATQGNIVIVSAIALFNEVHALNKQFPDYCEIYLESNQEILAERDKKSVYKKNYLRNKNVVGLDIKPQFPQAPHRLIPNSQLSHSEIDIDELYSFTLSFMRPR